MTIVPRWIVTGDVRSGVEVEAFSGTPAFSTDVRSFTGARSLRAPGSTSSLNAWGKNIPASPHMRLGYYLNYSGLAGTVSTELLPLFGRFSDTQADKTLFSINRRASDDNIIPIVNGSALASLGTFASIGLGTVDNWYHIGLICQIGEPGYAAFFINGTLVWSHSGDITGDITRVDFSERSAGTSTNNRWNVGYFDDIYADDITGETNTAPPAYRFLHRLANAAGEDAAWDSTEANNYQAVDENPHDGDTTYNFSEVTGQKDTHAASSISVPAGHTVEMRHPYAIARRTSTDDAVKLRLHAFDGTVYKSSAALDLGLSYGLVFASQDSLPDDSPLTEAGINAGRIGYESVFP